MKPNNRQELGRRNLIDLMEKVEGGRDIIDVPSRYIINNYIIKLFAHIFIYIYILVYMLAIAGQTARPNWLIFFEGIL